VFFNSLRFTWSDGAAGGCGSVTVGVRTAGSTQYALVLMPVQLLLELEMEGARRIIPVQNTNPQNAEGNQ
jgi:hypothetical protein